MPKRKALTLLPELRDITIYQSNRVTNIKRNYTLLQERVFTWVMWALQNDINKVKNGTQIYQLPLFAQQESELLALNIPLNYIGDADQYGEIRDAITQVGYIPVKVRHHEGQHDISTTLFSLMKMPIPGSRSKNVTLSIHKDVAKMLIHIDRNNEGKPAKYTTYMLHVAAMAKVKYTSPLYKILCSWRSRGGWAVSVSDLRELLGIPEGTYKNFSDFKRFVLEPVAKELKEFGDLWFNCADATFEEREGRKVVGLKFKILQPVTEEIVKKKIAHIKWLIVTQFTATAAEVDKLAPIFVPGVDFAAILQRIEDRAQYIRNHKEEIKHPPAVIIKDLLNIFGPR